MQSEVLYGARFSAIFNAIVPVFFLIVFLVSNSGDIGGTKIFFALGAIGWALWQMRGAFKPKQLVMDRYGLTYHPPFSSVSTQIKWPQVSGFEIKGKDNKRRLILHYLSEENSSAQTLNLGEGWSADGKDVFADKLENVRDYLDEIRLRYQLTTQSAAVSAQRPLVEVANKKAPQAKPRAIPQRANSQAIVQVSAQARQQASTEHKSGQVYAAPSVTSKAATMSSMPSLNGHSQTNDVLGWVLLGGGTVVAMLMVIPFMRLCNRGYCDIGIWDVADLRLWVVGLVWAVCAVAVWIGVAMISSRRKGSL